MFSQKKGKVDITHNSPTFYVRYVGKIEVFTSSGKGCTKRPVQRIWDASVDEKDMAKCTLDINSSGILLTYIDEKNKPKVLYDIQDVSYCSAESMPHERVFAWICKNMIAKKLECHAVVCGGPEKAQMISVCLNRAFQIAYRDWKTHKEKQERMKQHGLMDKGQSSRSESRNDQSSRSEKEEMRNGKHSTEEVRNGKAETNGTLSAKEEEELNAALAQMNFVEEEELNGGDRPVST